MIPVRHSPDAGPNVALKPAAGRGEVTNLQWLEPRHVRYGILLLGGTSVIDFRLRVAQSHVRTDLLPSFWSIAALLQGDGKTMITARLDRIPDAAEVPGQNAVQVCRLSDYDDPQAYSNIAVLRFGGDPSAVETAIARVRSQRSVVDLVSLLIPWLGFVWGAGQQANPLLQGNGIPSAAFVEAVYALAGVELTPGLATASSCPEAIWQAAKWWRSYYDQTREGRERVTKAEAPSGTFLIRQPAAAVLDKPEKQPPSRSRTRR